MVDENKLVELIAAKSGQSHEEVNAELDSLIQEIQAAGQKNQAYTIDGLGTFKQKDDETCFEPNKAFELEINQKYAGMKPIELVGSYKQPAAESPAEPVEIPHQPTEESEQPKPDIAPEPSESQPDDKEEPLSTDEPVTHEPEPAETEAKTSEKEPVSSDETGTGSIVLIIFTIIVAILLTGWLLYQSGIFSDQDTNVNATSTQEVVTEQMQTTNASASNQASTVPAKTDKSNLTDNSLSSETNQQQSPTYGLKGTYDPAIKDGYTIIVHSLVRKDHAYETLGTIKQKGFRAIMLKAHVNGSKYWRLGIGQFETTGDAQKAAQTLKEPYKSNHFIKYLDTFPKNE